MCRIIVLFLSIMLLTISVVHAAPRAMIIDTDAAFDDMLAITYLLQRPDIDVKAITVSATGESHCLPAKSNLHVLTKMLGHGNIPITCGRNTPLRGTHKFPIAWSTFTDSLGNAEIVKNKLIDSSKDDAVPLIKDLLTHAKVPYDILALGPLTNLGEAFQQNPDLIKHIHMIYIMGGAVEVPGNLQIADKNLNNTAEWNFYIDPYSVDLVFRSGAPITLIPLDATNFVKLDTVFFQILNRSTVHAASLISQLHDAAVKYELDGETDANFFVWDTVAAVIASDPSIANSKIRKLSVILEPDHDSGALVVDNEHGSPINVCQRINYPLFLRNLTYFLTHSST